MNNGIIFIDEHPFAREDAGRLKSRIATAFPLHDTLVTLPLIHVQQRRRFLARLDEERAAAGMALLTREEKDVEWTGAVDLIVQDDAILIRPEPDRMDLAYLADEMLQRLLPVQRIHFLGVLNEKVRDAIKRRGELWRITQLPKTPEEMRAMIEASRIGIAGREIYYYSEVTGTRFLTFQQFDELGLMEDERLRAHLLEIGWHIGRSNAAGNPEVALFGAGHGVARADFRLEYAAMDGAQLRRAFSELREKLRASVRPQLLRDDPQNMEWRNVMIAALVGRGEELLSEQTLLGLSPEFFMQIEWLPGGRIVEGELVLDPSLERAPSAEEASAQQNDDKPKKFILNFVREYGDLEFVNIGRVSGSLSRRAAMGGTRGVYFAVLKQHHSPEEIVTIIRLQKQGVREFLDQGSPLLDAMIRNEEYTEYILDRRLGCHQLGMNLPVRVTAKKMGERYVGAKGVGFPIWTTYFEREYIRGIATDKLPPARFESEEFALAVARLLGQAAAPNIVVGRCDANGGPLFDDGDEVLIIDPHGMPQDLVVADHTGTFSDYACPLGEFTVKYAVPVTRRAGFLPDPAAFAEAYLEAFKRRLRWIQEEYRRRRRAFDSLFLHLPSQEAGSFAYRWKRVLERLDATDPAELVRLIRGNIKR
jgi:hypothetical protein